MESPKGMDVDMSESRGRRGGSVLSIDDPDVRLAAEALGDLRAGMRFYSLSSYIPTNFSAQTSFNPLLKTPSPSVQILLQTPATSTLNPSFHS